ncbi:MAG: hypothetical protein JSU98_05840 [Gemmatimonadales bacterium]|jgi:hypothetical protein|nr:MAG: hypothetical protein JSU98_05840 [Gemmatimonadales bacterium]
MIPTSDAALVRELSGSEPVVAVELRPPPAELDTGDTMEAWIDLHHVLRRFAGQGRFVFVTDNAVGKAEEENLAHLMANLPEEVSRDRVVPILTSKHSLEYCLLYAQRAAAAGIEALTVVGGDKDVGPPRCVPHAHLLRERIRRRVPALGLGGWANPHRPAEEQAGFLTAPDFHATFYLTQVVSHHTAGSVEALQRELENRGASHLRGLAGVFLYRSANPGTLERLGQYFPVPAREITAEFEAGASAEEICGRSVRALLDAGAAGVYLSNLGFRGAGRRLRRILEAASR